MLYYFNKELLEYAYEEQKVTKSLNLDKLYKGPVGNNLISYHKTENFKANCFRKSIQKYFAKRHH